MYSPTQTASTLATYAKEAETDVVKEQEFYNSKLGLPHIPAGSSVSDTDLNTCIQNFKMDDPKLFNKPMTLGVDVGSLCHYVIQAWDIDLRQSIDINSNAFAHLVKAGTFRDFADLYKIIQRYKPIMGVIDDMPETRKALEIARMFPGRIKLCHYGNNLTTRDISDHGERITVDRTSWLDQTIGRITSHRVALPADIPMAYREHMKAILRVPRENKNGDVVFLYKHNGADHYGHASNYAEIALRLSLSTLAGSYNMTESIR